MLCYLDKLDEPWYVYHTGIGRLDSPILIRVKAGIFFKYSS
jgi:hypothetical protein